MKPSLLVFLALVGVCHTVSLNTFWTQEDTQRLSNTFQNTLSSRKDSIASLHYAASGLKLLKVEPTAASAQAACDIAKKVDVKDLESLYHAASLSGDLPNCALSSVTGAKETIDTVLTHASTGEKIFHALSIADRLAIKVDKVAYDKALTAALKDDSPANFAAVLNAATLLDKSLGTKYFDKIASLVAQADEVDKKYLELEGGVGVTSHAVHGILALAAQQGKAAPLTQEKLIQFANYLLSHKSSSGERIAYHLLQALGALANNQHTVPVVVSLITPVSIDSGKALKVQVSNVLGLPVAVSAVKADSTIADKTQSIVLTKSDTQGLVYELPAGKLVDVGFHSLAVKVESQDKKLIGLVGSQLKVTVSQEVVVENFKTGILDKDAAPGADLSSVAVFSKLSKGLVSDHTKRIYVSFTVKSKQGGKPIKPHQVFVVLKHSKTAAEVIYAADAQGSGAYTLDINLVKAHKDFDGLSGLYVAHLIIGDSTINTPIDWAFADITLTLPAGPINIVPKSEKINYDPLPSISHLFRQPEKRPSAFVSDVFTIICLAPLGLLVVLWLRIGINFGNMPVSLWTLIFHVSLAALFGLYFVFWLQLDMFETLKYLSIVGAITFISGNRLLRSIANNRKQKAE